MRAQLVTASLALFGCSLVYDPGQFQGGADAGADAGRARDAGDDGGRDGGRITLPDADMPDAGPDAGPPMPINLRIVNAVGADALGDSLESVMVMIDGTSTMLGFGCYTTQIVMSGAQDIVISDGGAGVTRPVVFTGDSLLVLARDRTGRLDAYVRPDLPPTAPGGRHGIEYLNVVRQTATDTPIYVVTEVRDSTVAPAELPFGQWSAEREYPTGIPASVALGYGRWVWLSFEVSIVTTFTLGDLTVSGYAILTGDADVNPLVPGGPRAILIPGSAAGPACGVISLQDPQVAVANLAEEGDEILRAGPQIFGCALNTAFGAVQVNANAVSLTVPVFATLYEIGLAPTRETACVRSSANVINLEGDVEPGHRYLIAVTGRLRNPDPGAWDVTLVPEGQPVFESQMGLGFTHLAAGTANHTVDILGAGTRHADDLPVEGTATDVIDFSVLPAFPWEVLDPMGTSVGRYRTPDALTGRGGQFFVVFDQEVTVGAPVTRMAFVRSTYARQWLIGVRSGI